MWLPNNQRKLLSFYYSKIGDSLNELDLDKQTLIASMKVVNSHCGEDDAIGAELEIMKIPIYKKVNDANVYLVARNLILINGSMNGMKQDSYGAAVYKMKCVSLTTEGADLGRKYSSWFTRWGLWWEEHKVNPVWTILGFIIVSLVSYAIGKLT